jgi:acetylornithine deacetylase/succinyl-diaminopimelate desuccinylase-like protein
MNQRPDWVLALVEEHLRKHLPLGVELEMKPGQTAPYYLADPRSPDSGAAVRSLQEVFGGEVAFIRLGGSIPIVSAFREILGAETLLLGLGLPDSRIHSPNENFPLDNFEAGIRLNQVVLKELAPGRS